MNRWREASFITNPAMQSAVETVSTASSTVSSVLNAYGTILNTLSKLMSLLPTTSDLSAVVQELVDNVFDVFNTGCYRFVDTGAIDNGGKPDGVEGFLKRWAASFDDSGDKRRPQFSDDADMAAVLLVVGANDLPSLTPLLSSLISFFDLEKLKDFEAKSLDVDWYDDTEDKLSTPPDWISGKLLDLLPFYKDAVELIKKGAGLFSTATGFGDQVEWALEAIEKKIAKLKQVSDDLSELVEKILALTGSGMYGIELTSTSGTKGLIEAAQQASLGNVYLDSDAYVVGVCLLAGGPDTGQFRTAYQMFMEFKDGD